MENTEQTGVAIYNWINRKAGNKARGFMTVKRKLVGAFLLSALILAFVGGIGWFGVNNLSKNIKKIVNEYPKISGLLIFSEAFNAIKAGESALLNQELEEEGTKQQYINIDNAWKKAESGFDQYEKSEKVPREEELWNKFKEIWNNWKESHITFIKIAGDLDNTGFRNRYFEGRRIIDFLLYPEMR